jgi:hypothetical protein
MYLFNSIRSTSLETKFRVTEAHLDDFKNVVANKIVKLASTIEFVAYAFSELQKYDSREM